jgi:hypothetical protein
LELEPGAYVIWATSENRYFVEAKVEADKCYIFEAKPEMGAFYARVSLEPIQQTTKDRLINIKKSMLRLVMLTPTDEWLKKNPSTWLELYLTVWSDIKYSNRKKNQSRYYRVT